MVVRGVYVTLVVDVRATARVYDDLDPPLRQKQNSKKARWKRGKNAKFFH